MVYLDYNATTPLEPEVVQAITESLTESWGNPSSKHAAGLRANNVISKAREQVASMIGALPSDIIFTSGGTEGNNWVLRTGIRHFHETRSCAGNCKGDGSMPRPHFITSNIEHDSIKLVLEEFVSQGLAEVTFVPVRHGSGQLDVEDVISAIQPTTIMISVMLANNETGVIQPVGEICRRVKSLKRRFGETERILLHTDAAQALGKIPVDVDSLGVDYLTIVGHKFYGPRIGALFALKPGKGSPMYPLLYGGGQERTFRPGTENTPMIAGLGKAAELIGTNLEKYRTHMHTVRDHLESTLEKSFGQDICVNGKSELSERLPNTCNVSFLCTDLKGHEILNLVPSLQASIGAACHAQDRPSHILLSIGVPLSVAWKAVRISVGRETTIDDIDEVVAQLQILFKKNHCK